MDTCPIISYSYTSTLLSGVASTTCGSPSLIESCRKITFPMDKNQDITVEYDVTTAGGQIKKIKLRF